MRKLLLLPSTILILLCGAGLLLRWAVLHPATSSAVTENWRLQPGPNVRAVAHRLASEGRIPPWSPVLFRIVARARGLDRHMHSGFFAMPEHLSAWKAVDILSGTSKAGIRFTLPEGRTCQDLSEILRQAQLSDSATFLALCHNQDSARKLGIPPSPSGMEGYLFPDTYLFGGGETPMDIARAMHRRFVEVLKASGDSTSPVWRRYGLSGVVTLASIVEREAAVRTEAPRISGVFWARLEQGITLGADPTVRYAVGKFTGSLTKSDLAIQSPYNTRLFPGLPPGPIANPGKAAIRAALRPDTSGGWLYFVGKDDGSREHFFSRDLNQHVHFKNEAARNRSRTGIGGP